MKIVFLLISLQWRTNFFEFVVSSFWKVKMTRDLIQILVSKKKCVGMWLNHQFGKYILIVLFKVKNKFIELLYSKVKMAQILNESWTSIWKVVFCRYLYCEKQNLFEFVESSFRRMNMTQDLIQILVWTKKYVGMWLNHQLGKQILIDLFKK